MSDCFDVRHRAEEHPRACLPLDAAPSSQWPDKMMRTYLWAMGIGSDASTSGYDSDTDSDSDPASLRTYSEPSSPASPTFEEMSGSREPSDSYSQNAFAGFSPASQGHSLPVLSRLRHAVSCDVDLRHSLPDSPRQPRLISIRASRTSRLGGYSMQKAAQSYTKPLLEVPGRDARGRNVPLTHPPSLILSPSPTIILSPPSSPRPHRNSFASFLSSSDYPSEPASSVCDDYETTSESSESAYNAPYEEDPTESARRTLYTQIIKSFRANIPEEKNVPRCTFTENAFNSMSMSRPDYNILTLDNSEISSNRSITRPGAHGWVVPRTSSLSDVLDLHAQRSPGGCHLFTKRFTGAKSRYQYLGYFRVVKRDAVEFEQNGLKGKLPTDLGPFFLQFLRYDWSIFSLMDTSPTSDARSVSTFESTATSEVSYDHRPRRRKSLPSVRIVTVGGVDFEMALTPIAWNHGSFTQ